MNNTFINLDYDQLIKQDNYNSLSWNQILNRIINAQEAKKENADVLSMSFCQVVICDFSDLRCKIIEKLKEELGKNYQVNLLQEEWNDELLNKLQNLDLTQNEQLVNILVITGLDKYQEEELRILNYSREQLAYSKLPILIFINRRTWQVINKLPADFKSFVGICDFKISRENGESYLKQLLQSFISKILTNLKENGCQNLDSNAVLLNNLKYLYELEYIEDELNKYSRITPFLMWEIEFLKGRKCFFANEIEQALEHFEAGLINLKSGFDNHDIGNEDKKEWEGILKYHQSLCYYQRYQNLQILTEKNENLSQALSYMKEAINIWNSSSKTIISKFVNYYQHLLLWAEDVNELKKITQKFISENGCFLEQKRYQEKRLRLAIGYAYQAECTLQEAIKLQRVKLFDLLGLIVTRVTGRFFNFMPNEKRDELDTSNFSSDINIETSILTGRLVNFIPNNNFEIINFVSKIDIDIEQAIAKAEEIYQNVSQERQKYCFNAWLELIIAKFKHYQGKIEEAKSILEGINLEKILMEKAIIVDCPSGLELYLAIIKEKYLLYLKEGDFLEAYKSKQEKYSIQQQFCLRIFVGPIPLKPYKLPNIDTESIAIEIDNLTCHKEFLEQLMETICPINNELNTAKPLIVLYGESGSGKSSLLQAGLIPKIKQQQQDQKYQSYSYSFKSPIIFKDYTNFPEKLKKELEQLYNVSFDNEVCLDTIINFLNEKSELNQCIFIILDQFEDILLDKTIHQDFITNFLKKLIDNCLAGVRIIISIREDNLARLERYLAKIKPSQDSEITEKLLLNLLSVEDTKLWLQNIQQRFPSCSLDNDLIDEIVSNLAKKDKNKPDHQIKPIELQILGAQLQSEQITSLRKYQEFAVEKATSQNETQTPKERFVEKFLENILKDCGFDDQDKGIQFLYEITEKDCLSNDDKNEIAQKFGCSRQRLEDSLEILILSGLVEQLSQNNYELSHDYLQNSFNQIVNKNAIKWYKRIQELYFISSKTKEFLKKFITRSISVIVLLVIILFFILYFNQSDDYLDNLNTMAENLINQSSDIDVPSLDRLQKGVNWGAKLKNELNKPLSFGRKPEEFAPIFYLLHNENDYLRLDNQLKLKDKLSGNIKDIDFSEDGKFLGIVGGSNIIRVWDLDSNRLLLEDSTHQGDIKTIAFYQGSDGQTFIATGDDRSKIFLWKVNPDEDKLEKMGELSIQQGWVTHLVISYDGNWIAAGNDEFIQLFQRTSSSQLEFDERPLIKPEESRLKINSIAFSITNNHLAIAMGNQIHLWKVSSRQVYQDKTWQTNQDNDNINITQVAFYPKDNHIVTVDNDGKIKVWTLKGNELIKHPFYTLNQDDVSIKRIAFDVKGQYLALATVGNSDKIDIIKVWKVLDSGNNISLQLFSQFKGDKGYDLHFNPKSDQLASVDQKEGNINLWRFTVQQSIIDEESRVKKINMRPWKKNQMIVLGTDKKAKIRDLSGQNITIHSWKNMEDMFYSPQGNLMVGIQSDGKLRVWEFKRQDNKNAWTELPNFEDYISPVMGLSFSQDEKYLAISHNQEYIEIWDVEQHRKMSEDRLYHPSGATQIKWSYSNDYLATVNESEAILWNFRNYEKVKLTFENGLKDISFHPQESLTAILDNKGKVSLFDLNKQEITKQYETNLENVASISFSSQGEYLLITTRNGKAKVFNTLGEEKAYLKNDSFYLFSPYQKRVVAYSPKKTTVTVYNIYGGKIAEFKHDSDGKAVKSVGFTSDGKQLIAAYNTIDKKGKIKIWEVSTLDELIERGCKNLKDYLIINQINGMEEICSLKETSPDP